MIKALFPAMQLIATPGALNLGIVLTPYLERHESGDYGEVSKDPHDKMWNDAAARTLAGMILSVYNLPGGQQLNIKTDFYARQTTIYLPEED